MQKMLQMNWLMLSMKSEVLHVYLRTNCISCITTVSCSQKTGKESRIIQTYPYIQTLTKKLLGGCGVAVGRWEVAVKGTRKQGNERERERESETGNQEQGVALVLGSFFLYRSIQKLSKIAEEGHPMTITSCWLEK